MSNKSQAVHDGIQRYREAVRAHPGWTVSQLARELDVSRATVYLWRRVGVAVDQLGVKPGTPEWTCLVGRSAATKSPVSGVLDSHAPTQAALEEALSVLFERDANGRLLPDRAR